MTALRTYARNRALPAELGDAGLALPDDTTLGALVLERLATSGALLESVELVHARWKPGVALVGLYRVLIAGHGERLVGYKRHVGGKGVRLAEEFTPEERASTAAAPLLATAPLEHGDGYLWTFPAERVLRGAQRAFEMTRFARRFDDAGVCPGYVLRKRATRIEVLRYKPERRVVARLDARLRGAGDARTERCFGLRALQLAEAHHVAALRWQLEAALSGGGHQKIALIPRLVHFDARDGVLIEEWLVGATHAPNDLSHAAEAGDALAKLHAAPTAGVDEGSTRGAAVGVAGVDVLSRIPETASVLREVTLALARCARTTRLVFVHGDFHPDQVLSTERGPRLMDLDTLGLGAPERDVASWIADHLTEFPSASFTEAAAILVHEYARRGGVLDPRSLGVEVSAALVARAAAAVRRLEVAAVQKAVALIARAAAVLAGEDTP